MVPDTSENHSHNQVSPPWTKFCTLHILKAEHVENDIYMGEHSAKNKKKTYNYICNSFDYLIK